MENTQPLQGVAILDWRAEADEIWATLREVGRKHEQTTIVLAETGKLIKETAEQMKETNRRIEETSEQMKETDRRFGNLGNRFGELVEHLITPNLVAKFRELQFEFTKAGPSFKIQDKDHDIFLEVDSFLENGDKVMIVEIKSKPSINDINDHIKRMEKLRVYADLHADKRKYLGAIGGVVFNESERLYALKNGFYLIEPSGDTFNITAPQGSYCPHEW